MKILYLFTEIMGYQMPVFSELVHKYQAQIHIIHWDQKKNTPYKPHTLDGVSFYERSSFTFERMLEFCQQFSPDLVVISGWQDRTYLRVARRLRASGTPVVAGFDDQWHGSLRQNIGAIAMRLVLRRLFFSHAWVAGPFQFEYARKMGFSKKDIIFNLYSCNLQLFKRFYESGKLKINSNFLYVGRFHTNKNIQLLIDAYQTYKSMGGTWGLICVGNGPLLHLIQTRSDVLVFNFLEAEQLGEVCELASGFILPSMKEGWGVVVQEFAAAGLPLILSDQVGARPVFLIDNFNGYVFNSASGLDLAEKMLQLSTLSNEEIVEMKKRSHDLGMSISPQMSAASLVSVLSHS